MSTHAISIRFLVEEAEGKCTLRNDAQPLKAVYRNEKFGYALGGLTEGAGGTLQAVRVRIRKEMPWLVCTGRRRGNRHRQLCGRWQCCTRMAGRMVGEMLHGIAGLVVMDRAVGVVVMMRGADEMVDFMGNVERFCRRTQAALHGDAMQRK
ncbi:hypothetical protein [Noviherbaspirillum denitrificans]|uniref:hypothetical protein n=1 Tax=Noviherbaspirillum denitrificans TaxID=1968433 RepID=UPI001130EE03|nr:hypothetical protein [Noviherbaspirillum denitrificans]